MFTWRAACVSSGATRSAARPESARARGRELRPVDRSGARCSEFTRNRFHYNWHWFWDYGNGDLGNQGIHEMDVARWGLGVGFPDEGHRHGRPLHVR